MANSIHASCDLQVASVIAAQILPCGPCSALQQARCRNFLEQSKVWACEPARPCGQQAHHARASGIAPCKQQPGRVSLTSAAVKTSASTTVSDFPSGNFWCCFVVQPVLRPLVNVAALRQPPHPGSASCRTLNKCSGGALQPDVHSGANEYCALTASIEQGSSRVCCAQADCGAAQSGSHRQVRLTHAAFTWLHPTTWHMPTSLIPCRCFTSPLWRCSVCGEQ